MVLRVVVLLLCCSVTALADTESEDYLEESLLSMPTNGAKARTPQPLAPYASYRITLVSPYNLRAVYSENQGSFETDIQIDGKSFKAIALDEGADGHIGKVEFLFRGYGKPIYIGFGKDRHLEIETAHIEIHRESWLERIWRERFSSIWQEYGILILLGVIFLPLLMVSSVIVFRRNRKIRTEERKAEKERQAIMINSHTKSLEVMREIDRRAQQKFQELVTRNFDELQKKIMYWRAKAYTESYFLNPELRQNFAVVNRDKIISELEHTWAEECMEIARDLQLAKALRDQEPGVMHWIQARQEVVNMAHKLSWSPHPIVDAYFEVVPNDPQIIMADEVEGTDEFSQRRARRSM